jgi:hypothetical protein
VRTRPTRRARDERRARRVLQRQPQPRHGAQQLGLAARQGPVSAAAVEAPVRAAVGQPLRTAAAAAAAAVAAALVPRQGAQRLDDEPPHRRRLAHLRRQPRRRAGRRAADRGGRQEAAHECDGVGARLCGRPRAPLRPVRQAAARERLVAGAPGGIKAVAPLARHAGLESLGARRRHRHGRRRGPWARRRRCGRAAACEAPGRARAGARKRRGPRRGGRPRRSRGRRAPGARVPLPLLLLLDVFSVLPGNPQSVVAVGAAAAARRPAGGRRRSLREARAAARRGAAGLARAAQGSRRERRRAAH